MYDITYIKTTIVTTMDFLKNGMSLILAELHYSFHLTTLYKVSKHGYEYRVT